jgi:membrane protein
MDSGDPSGPAAARSPIPTEPAPIVLPDFVPRFIGRLLELGPVRLVRVVMEVYGRAGGGLLASGIAYRVLFAVAPAILLFVSILGFVVADAATRAAIVEALGAVFPPLAEILDSSLEALVAGAVSVSLISTVILLWGASGLYLAIEEGIARMIPFGPLRDPARRTIFGLLAVVVLIGGTILLLVLAAIADVLGGLVIGDVEAEEGPLPIGRVMTVVGSAVLVALAYRFLPTVRPPWAAALGPGLLSGAAIGLLTVLFVVIAPRLAGLAFLYGSLATVLVTLAWVGIVSQILLIGAAWTAVRWARSMG